MTIKGEFIPLSLLIPSLESNQKLYFLYRRASETGSRGAMLRFHSFTQSLPEEELDHLKSLFAASGAKRRTA